MEKLVSDKEKARHVIGHFSNSFTGQITKKTQSTEGSQLDVEIRLLSHQENSIILHHVLFNKLKVTATVLRSWCAKTHENVLCCTNNVKLQNCK